MSDIERAQLTEAEIAQLAEAREIQEPELNEISGGTEEDFFRTRGFMKAGMFREDNFRAVGARREDLILDENVLNTRAPEEVFFTDNPETFR